MIEVEIKVCVNEMQKEELIKGAQLIEEASIVDHYYDSRDFRLTTNGYWLRKRNGEFELKMPATKSGGFNINKNIPMREICDINMIAEILELPIDLDENNFIDMNFDDSSSMGKEEFEFALEAAGYKAMYKFVNTRKSYAKDGLRIDFDIADFGDLTYSVCEIESIVDSQDKTDCALENLYDFVRKYGISTDKAEGKISHYIRLKNPVHYRALLNSCKDGEL